MLFTDFDSDVAEVDYQPSRTIRFYRAAWNADAV